MSAFLSTSRAIALVIIATTAAPAIAQTSLPVGATALMRYWTENGTFYLNCIHPSCIEGSLVSMKPMDGKPVPASADFHREQLQVAKAGAGRIAARGGELRLGKPSVRTSRGVTTMQLRGEIRDPGHPRQYVTRGMIYCGACTVSVVSTSTSKARAEAMFAHGYSFCPKN